MSLRDQRREASIERMADHVLSEGLAGATLRPLAAAAGTSDRMLLYYFSNREEMLTAVLDRIAARMLGRLEEAIPVGPRWPFSTLLGMVWAVLGSDELTPYTKLWLDLASGAARDLQPQRRVAGAIVDGYLAWVTARMKPPQGGKAAASSAALFISTIQGMYLLTAVGRPAIAEQAIIEFSGRSVRIAARPANRKKRSKPY